MGKTTFFKKLSLVLTFLFTQTLETPHSSFINKTDTKGDEKRDQTKNCVHLHSLSI